MRITDLGMVSRDDDVAKQRNRRAESNGMAIHPRDDRLVAFQHAEHDPPRLGHTGIPCVRIVNLLLHGDHVPAGRKRSTRPVRTTTFTSGSSLTSSQMRDIEVCIGPVNALRVSGEFKVMVSTLSCRTTSTPPYWE